MSASDFSRRLWKTTIIIQHQFAKWAALQCMGWCYFEVILKVHLAARQYVMLSIMVDSLPHSNPQLPPSIVIKIKLISRRCCGMVLSRPVRLGTDEVIEDGHSSRAGQTIVLYQYVDLQRRPIIDYHFDRKFAMSWHHCYGTFQISWLRMNCSAFNYSDIL